MKDKALKIIQISDVHLGKDKGSILLGVKTHESFKAVIELVKREQPQLDAILLSGDLSQDASPAAYESLADTLQILKAPVYAIPGNHDDPKVMAQIYPRYTVALQKQILFNHWQIILLDSHKPGAVEGFLAAKEFAHLQECLNTQPTQSALIVLHHQPVPAGSTWLDKIGLQNAEEFWHVLSAYPQVKTVLCGHVHQELSAIKQGTQCFALPSTCIQFKPKQKDFYLDHQPPGYRWLNLYEDGRVETGVRRLDHYVGIFEENAKGY
jgi:Icc protein